MEMRDRRLDALVKIREGLALLGQWRRRVAEETGNGELRPLARPVRLDGQVVHVIGEPRVEQRRRILSGRL